MGIVTYLRVEPTGNTVFRKRIPITIDSGLVSLSGGDTVKLKYVSNWESTSKIA